MTICIEKLTDYLTIFQQQQDDTGLMMGYIRRMHLSNQDLIITLNWLKENKPELCYEVFYKDLPNLDLKSCEECADSNWDGG